MTTLQYINNIETFEKAQEEKKKSQWNQKKNKKDSNLNTGVNMTDVSK